MEGGFSALRGGGVESELFNDQEEVEACLEWMAPDAEEGEEQKNKPGGSRPGKRPNKPRDFKKHYDDLISQYFCDDPVYDERDFRRRFRMSKRLFLRIFDAVVQADPYFERRCDAVGKPGIYPVVKVVAALRVLAYALPADAIDENFGMAKSTVIESIHRFADALDKQFGATYLRQPDKDDIERLLRRNAERGFVGMLFSLDCMHWEWKNCPTAESGQFKGKEKKPTVVLEACADEDLWIWHASFGWPGSLNDINILDRSTFFDRIYRGEAPEVSFLVNGHRYDMAYCLADGIYPDWPVFLKTISEPGTNKRKYYAKMQEGCRKDVERAFVLQARWRIVDVPCQSWDRLDMCKTMKACIIMHNMIIEDERDLESANDYLFDQETQPAGLPQFVVSRPRGMRSRSIADVMELTMRVEDESQYFRLRDDLVEHLWQLHAEEM